jgi:DNA-binding PadR family transcriptional regulator
MAIEFGILGLLNRRPMYGYELREELQAEIGSHYKINYGTLYRVLDRLRRKEYIECKTVAQTRFPDRKVYRIKEKGRQHWLSWLSTPITAGSILKNDFYLKLVLSFTSPVSPLEVIEQQRQADIKLIQALTKLKRKADPKLQVRWLILLEAAIFQVEGRLKWLELCHLRLNEMQKADNKSLSVKELTALKDIFSSRLLLKKTNNAKC